MQQNEMRLMSLKRSKINYQKLSDELASPIKKKRLPRLIPKSRSLNLTPLKNNFEPENSTYIKYFPHKELKKSSKNRSSDDLQEKGKHVIKDLLFCIEKLRFENHVDKKQKFFLFLEK